MKLVKDIDNNQNVKKVSDKEAEDDINDANTDTKKEHIRRDVNITVEDIKIGADFNIED